MDSVQTYSCKPLGSMVDVITASANILMPQVKNEIQVALKR
jgi:hypothetical protein